MTQINGVFVIVVSVLYEIYSELSDLGEFGHDQRQFWKEISRGLQMISSKPGRKEKAC
jgi:hypothetical protein